MVLLACCDADSDAGSCGALQLNSRGAILNDSMFRTNNSADYIAQAAKVSTPSPSHQFQSLSSGGTLYQPRHLLDVKFVHEEVIHCDDQI